jgi:hypothetical protein
MSKNNTASLLPFVQGRYIENSRWYMGSVMTFLVNSEHTLRQLQHHGVPVKAWERTSGARAPSGR